MKDHCLSKPPGWRVTVSLGLFLEALPFGQPADPFVHRPGGTPGSLWLKCRCPARCGGSRRALSGQMGPPSPRMAPGQAHFSSTPAGAQAPRRGRWCKSRGRQCEGAGPG